MWDRVASFFAELPEDDSRAGQLLLATIASRYSAEGLLSTALADPARDPVLHLAYWGLDDLGHHASQIAESLAEAAAFDSISGEFLAGEDDHIQLIVENRATSLYRAVVGERSAFWNTRGALWQRRDRVSTAIREGADIFGEELLLGSRMPVIHGSIGAALDAVTNRGDRFASAFIHQACALTLEQGLVNLAADLQAGRVNPATTAAVFPTSAHDPGLIFLIATGQGLHRQLLDRALEEAGFAAESLAGLPQLSRYASELMDRLRRLRKAISDDSTEPLRPLPSGPTSSITKMRIPSAIESARRFLLTDPEMAEAREVHRWLILDDTEMTSIVPLFVPLEVLRRRGSDVGIKKWVEAWLLEMNRRDYAYYDHPKFDGLDSDTAAAVLLLSEETDEMLARVELALKGKDRVPVWLERTGLEGVRLTGEGCGAVAANLLVALKKIVPERFDSMASGQLERLLSDFVEKGTAIAVDYVASYLLVPMAKLAPVGEARERLKLEIERLRATKSPQAAAFLTLAVSESSDLGKVDWRWIGLLLRSQRHDGGWEAEPLFWVNGADGGAQWYQSRTVTTAFCFDALCSVVAAI